MDITPVRSLNNNMFRYSNKWNSWSRILFYDPDTPAMEKTRKRYGVPKNIVGIELDLTAINPDEIGMWRDKIQHASIRFNRFAIDPTDHLTGTLPEEAVYVMSQWLTDDCITKLVHGDYMEMIDFNNVYKAIATGSASFSKLLKSPPDLDNYWYDRIMGGNPGILKEDCSENFYKWVVPKWEAKRDALLIVNGLQTK